MARESVYAPLDTGRYAYLGPDERPDGPEDGRSRIVYRHPFWKDEEERLRYERAAAACPVQAYGNLTLDEYLRAIVEVAEGLRAPAAVKVMP